MSCADKESIIEHDFVLSFVETYNRHPNKERGTPTLIHAFFKCKNCGMVVCCKVDCPYERADKGHGIMKEGVEVTA